MPHEGREFAGVRQETAAAESTRSSGSMAVVGGASMFVLLVLVVTMSWAPAATPEPEPVPPEEQEHAELLVSVYDPACVPSVQELRELDALDVLEAPAVLVQLVSPAPKDEAKEAPSPTKPVERVEPPTAPVEENAVHEEREPARLEVGPAHSPVHRAALVREPERVVLSSRSDGGAAPEVAAVNSRLESEEVFSITLEYADLDSLIARAQVYGLFLTTRGPGCPVVGEARSVGNARIVLPRSAQTRAALAELGASTRCELCLGFSTSGLQRFVLDLQRQGIDLPPSQPITGTLVPDGRSGRFVIH